MTDIRDTGARTGAHPGARNAGDFHRGLETLLQRQLRRIRQRFFVHGAGSVLAAIAAAIVLYYLLDRYLRLPGAVRVLLSVGLAIYVGYLVRRFILYPIRRSLTRRDVALAIEQRFPDLQHKLISAIQLGSTAAAADDTVLRNQSRAMIDQVIADAAEHADRIPHGELLSPRRTARIWAIAATLGLVVGGFAALNPDVAGVFARRIFGARAEYPRATYLVVEQPAPGVNAGVPNPEYHVSREDGVVKVTLAAGGDLPVLVRAEGVVPREVDLRVRGGRGLPPTIAMSARSDQYFEYTFRRVAEGFSFHPTGGDDIAGEARVDVAVLFPPRVEQVRARITYPAYTRRPPPPVQEGGSIEALIGSAVQFHVTATMAVVAARIRFLESGQELALEPIEVADDAGVRTVYRGSLKITRSDRYQVQLVGTEGLRNPNPGTYQIVANPDHPPVSQILSPLDDGLNVALPDAIIALRLTARDDYGLTKITATLTGRDQGTPVEIPLFAAAAEAEPIRERVVLTYIDLAKGEFKSHANIGQSIVLTATLADNREPEAMAKTVGPRQVRIIGETDLLRRVSAHFRRVRDDVEQNLKLLMDRNDRLSDLIDELERGSPLAQQQLAIAYVEVALGRIQAAASRIHMELMRIFNFHLFNRLEPSAHAATVLDLYRTFHENRMEPESFFPEFYRDLATRRQDGRLGAMDKTLDPILQMTQAADRVAESHALQALRLLAKARVAESNKDAAAALTQARAHQRSMIEEFESLLNRLDRWNEFQDVITNARTLLDQQRDVRARAKNLQGKDK